MTEPISFRDKVRSVGVIGRRSGSVVRDGHRPNGERCKHTTDELGNTITESANRQDVAIHAPHVRVALEQREVRSGTG